MAQLDQKIEQANKSLSRVKLRNRNGIIILRGMFPENGKMVRKQISLKCKEKDFEVALAKAKEIDAQLVLGKWTETEDDNNNTTLSPPSLPTVKEVLNSFIIDYWKKFEKTIGRAFARATHREYAWRKNQEAYFGYLPEDEVFEPKLIERAIASFPPGSYSRKKFCQIIRPVTKFVGMEFDFKPYMNYSPNKLDIMSLPTDEQIISAFETEKYYPHKWSLGVLATFGLRPHELFRSKFCFEDSPPVIRVGHRTKTKERIVFPLPIDGINIFDLEIPIFPINTERANQAMGMQVTAWFKKYPFTPYSLRHYYAVRGALLNISPVTLSKWMGHSLSVHYDHYGSLIGEKESRDFWLKKFSPESS
jgi:integrase